MSWLNRRKAIAAATAAQIKKVLSVSDTNLPWYLANQKAVVDGKTKTIEDVWKYKASGKGTFVTIYDTCIDEAHNALKGRAFNQAKCALNKEGLDRAHGTASAGVIAGKDNTYKTLFKNIPGIKDEVRDVRISGVAPGAAVFAILQGQDDPAFFTKENSLQRQFSDLVESRGYIFSFTYDGVFINYSGSGGNEWGVMTSDRKETESFRDNLQSSTLIVVSMGNKPEHLDEEGCSKHFPASKAASKLLGSLVIAIAGTGVYDKAQCKETSELCLLSITLRNQFIQLKSVQLYMCLPALFMY